MIATSVGISLEIGCEHAACGEFAAPRLDQMDSGKYDECSVLPIPEIAGDWRGEHRTARKRAGRAARRGYIPGILKREDWADDIFAINTSSAHRQGRPMTAGYTQRQAFSPLPFYPCGRHAIRTSGVWAPDGHLVCYLVMYRVGEMALVSQILGHADHLGAEIMYLLFEFALGREIVHGPGYVVYNRHDSGTDGLRWFKERLGFRPMEVEWLP